MRRSLHVKLMLIMVLLIISLMVVVGAFLMNSVTRYYIDDFYAQIEDAFGQSHVDFVRDLQNATEGETDGAAKLDEVLGAYGGVLGIDGRNRNYYVLDGTTGKYLAGSAEPQEGGISVTPNITSAILGKIGLASSAASDYMDAAIPITRGGQQYIIYILDNRATAQALNAEMFTLILEALVLGLIISVLLSFLLSKTMIAPLQRLTAAIEQVAEGDFSRTLEVTSGDEIGQLTESFNAMAGQLKTTIAAVENEKDKLNTLFLHMADGVAAFDRQQLLIHSNPAASNLLGRTFTPVDRYSDLFPDLGNFNEILNASAPQTEQRTVGTKILEFLVAPFSRQKEGGVLVLIHDVTEQVTAEQQRKDFVANVSHELRTPLTNIKSYAETLSDSVGDLPPSMQKRFLTVILNESDRMTHILQDLLTLSRFDSGRSELRLTTFPFLRILDDTYQAIRLDAQNHSHTLELSLPPELPDVTADRERIMQVLMNIVSNSIKYTPDGGRIVISAGVEGKKVWAQVEDNGIGIPAADREHIFERFYRVDKARSRKSGGTGLGLSIATEIMKQHEGRLYLVDKSGPGLIVRMELPIAGPSKGKGGKHEKA